MDPKELSDYLKLAHETKVLNLQEFELNDDNFKQVIAEIPKIEGLLVIHIENSKTTPSICNELFLAILKCPKLLSLTLNYCELDNNVAINLFNTLEKHPALLNFDAMGNELLKSKESNTALKKFLSNHKSILSVNLYGNDISPSEALDLISNLNQNKKILNLNLGEGFKPKEQLEIESILMKHCQEFNRNSIIIPRAFFEYLLNQNDGKESTLELKPLLFIGYQQNTAQSQSAANKTTDETQQKNQKTNQNNIKFK